MNRPVHMPEMGENIDQGIVTRVEVAVGDKVDIGQTLIEVESDKVVLEVPAEVSGTIQELLVNEGDKVEPGERLANILIQDSLENPAELEDQEGTDNGSLPRQDVEIIDKSLEQPGQQNTYPNQPVRHSSATTVYAGPSAQRLARELGVGINQVSGTSKDGRISRADIKAFVQKQGTGGLKQRPPLPDFSAITEIERKPLGGIARTTARNMANAWERIPHAWLQIKVDITQLEEIRDKLKKKDKNKKSGLTVFILKALTQALQEFPKFNACFDDIAEELVFKKDIHIGLAVDTPRGLLVPVLKNTNQSSLPQLSEQLQLLTEAGRQNQFTAEQLQGAGMTLSSLGGMGIDTLFPIINWPEVAILGVGAANVESVWQQNQFIPCAMLNLVLGFDHRVINGADGARFLNHLQHLLEKPFLLAL